MQLVVLTWSHFRYPVITKLNKIDHVFEGSSFEHFLAQKVKSRAVERLDLRNSFQTILVLTELLINGPVLSITVAYLFIYFFDLFFYPRITEEDSDIINKYLEKFPKFDVDKIADLKLQFQAFDLNHDGLIDFNEM